MHTAIMSLFNQIIAYLNGEDLQAMLSQDLQSYMYDAYASTATCSRTDCLINIGYFCSFGVPEDLNESRRGRWCPYAWIRDDYESTD